MITIVDIDRELLRTYTADIKNFNVITPLKVKEFNSKTKLSEKYFLGDLE